MYQLYQLYQLYQIYQVYQTKQNCEKIAAEELCRHFAFTMGLPSIRLRTARFFPEAPELMALYWLYRGMDVRDAVAAHMLAVTNQDILFDVFNIAAHSITPDFLWDVDGWTRGHKEVIIGPDYG
jgi:hypothetical protein